MAIEPCRVAVLSWLLLPSLVAQAVPEAEPVKPDERPAASSGSEETDALPPISSLELPFERLQDWGTRAFEYHLPGAAGPGTWVKVGSVELTTEVDGDRITLRDHWELTYEGVPLFVDTTISGPLSGCLRPDSIEAEGTTDDGDGSTFEVSATLDATTMHTAKRDKPVPAEAVTVAGLFRLVTLLPTTPDFAARFEAQMDASELNVKDGSVIHFAGRSQPPESPEGIALPCFHITRIASDKTTPASIRVTSKATGAPLKILPKTTTSPPAGNTWLQVWLDEGDHISQMLMDDRKLFVATKKP